jgi:hypothetical protein
MATWSAWLTSGTGVFPAGKKGTDTYFSEGK